jgi:hypothetical protein
MKLRGTNLWRGKWFVRATVFLGLILLFYLGFLNYTEPTQIGITWNVISGEMCAKENGGWHISPPWVWMVRIDARPMRVAITTGGHGYNAKLIQFNPKAWRDFISTEGWRYYWWSNRFSFNLGYHEEYRGFRDVMRGYAFSAKKYPFVTFINEYESQ